MQDISRNRVIAFVVIGALFVGLVALFIVVAISRSHSNQFGNLIKIQNYDQTVELKSSDVKDVIQSTLYRLVKKNSAESFDPLTVSDAFIREGSYKQNHNTATDVYSGTFIVDMASIKQSYLTQYSFSNTNTLDIGGNPIILSCLPKEKLKYGEFKCKDFVMEQTSKYDGILQYLPYQNFSFKITPDATAADGNLTLDVTLTIPESDLKGDVTSRTKVVALHKKEVTDWIKSKGQDPSKFIIIYNYTDTGELITR